MAARTEKTSVSIDKDAISPERSHYDAQPDEFAKHDEAHEVFQREAGHVDFRTVSWPRATVIFLKIQFAMSILAVPGALATLGAVGGALSIVGWGALNTCTHCPNRSILSY